MFVIVRTERPRDEVAPFILSKISEGVAELPLLKLLRIEYFEPNYDFSVLIRIFNSWRLKSRQI